MDFSLAVMSVDSLSLRFAELACADGRGFLQQKKETPAVVSWLELAK